MSAAKDQTQDQEPTGRAKPAAEPATGRVTKCHVFEERWMIDAGPTSKDGKPLPPPTDGATIHEAKVVKALVLRAAAVSAPSRNAATDVVAKVRPEAEQNGTFLTMLSADAPKAQQRKVEKEVVEHVSYADVDLEVVE